MARACALRLLCAALLAAAAHGQFKHRGGKGPRKRELDFDAWETSHGARKKRSRSVARRARAHVAFAAPPPRAGCSFAPLPAGHAFSREERKLRRARFASARADIDAHNARWCVRGGAP